MNSADQVLEQEMAKAALFLRQGVLEVKQGNLVFKLGHKKTVDSADKVGRASFYRSFEHVEIEDALEDLRKAIIAYGPTSQAYISVSLVSSGRSNNDYVTTLINPYYQGVNNTSTSISGFGGNINTLQNNSVFQMQQSQQSMLMQLQAQMHQQQLESERQLTKLRHDQALKEKEDHIEALEYGQKSNIAKIGELADSQAGVVLVNYAIGF